MKTITIANQKGGCGKTTTATALASILKDQGFKTVLIDADMQGNSTDTYKAQIEGEATLYDVIIADDKTPIEEAIQKMNAGDIVASDPLLQRAEGILKEDHLNGLYRMQEALEGLKGYDFAIIDTAPNMGMLLLNCLIASDFLVIPVTTDRYALQGLAQLNEAVQTIKKRENKGLKIAGLLQVKYNKRMLLSKETTEALEEIAKSMGTKLFETTIRESTKAREAQAKRMTLFEYAPSCTTAEDYKAFASELLKEI